MNKLCLIFNTAPLYRTKIYCEIDKYYDCDWFFGPKREDIKEMQFSRLSNVHFYKLYGNPSRMSWKSGILSLLFQKEYQTYLMYPEVHCVTDWFFFLMAFTIFRKKKIYLWTHGWYGKEGRLEAMLKRWLFKNATGVFAYSDYAKKLMIEQGVSGEKIYTIHNSLDYDRQLPLRNSNLISDIYKEHFHNDNPVIVIIGRLNKRKKISMLINAIGKLKKSGENYNVVIIGDGEDKQNIEERIKNLDLTDNFYLYGACYDERTNAVLLSNADLCVIPGDVGLTAIHSLTFGVPVITHNRFPYQGPEFEAIVPEKTGLFFHYDNEDSLVETISRWFSEFATDRKAIRQYCYDEIDNNWTPDYQMNVIKQVLF